MSSVRSYIARSMGLSMDGGGGLVEGGPQAMGLIEPAGRTWQCEERYQYESITVCWLAVSVASPDSLVPSLAQRFAVEFRGLAEFGDDCQAFSRRSGLQGGFSHR